MRVAIGADHAGFELKENLGAHPGELGYQIVNVGTHSTDPVDTLTMPKPSDGLYWRVGQTEAF